MGDSYTLVKAHPGLALTQAEGRGYKKDAQAWPIVSKDPSLISRPSSDQRKPAQSNVS